ncbi:ParM/StbA family protein [Cyanobacteria bacterium FACHB-63]|nr:ParM/StbA family protein [Cyanobacteria bacterium FACHB-63]
MTYTSDLETHSQPSSDSSSLKMTIGLDCGNGGLKLASNVREIYIPSYVLELHKTPGDIPNSGYVKYLTGDLFSLTGKEWIGGTSAVEFSPLGAKRVTDSADGKIQYALPLLLSALTTLPHCKEIDLSLVASIHDSETLGAELQSALEGTHIVTLGSHPASTIVRVKVLRVLPEGSAALVENRSNIAINGVTLTLDVGNGTVIGSAYAAGGKRIDSKMLPMGVENLIDRIARNVEMRRFLTGREGDRHLIRRGIENRSFVYGSTNFSFETIYRTEIRSWISEVLAPITSFLNQWSAGADARLAIGGGCKLPLLDQALTQKGYSIASDPVWSNARGLCKIAQKLSSEAV